MSHQPGRKILVVEDDYTHREVLKDQLGSWGHEVLAVESAESALSNLLKFAPQLVISDIGLGDMDGLELLRRIRDHDREIDVIMITGHTAVQYAIDAMKEGAYDYLMKPLDLEQIESVLGRCFRDRDAREASEDRGVDFPASSGDGFVGRHPSMLKVFKLIGAVAASDAPVLVRGETGTGKELVARMIHQNSRRADEPFVSVECTSVADGLIESELFGHVQGAFTGATRNHRGRFEMARGGTILLDEIGDTSLAFQAKLLRVLQESEVTPVGAEESRSVRARVVAATRRPIEKMVDEGEFREDLMFRLRVVEIVVPPLRERASDIPLLANHFLSKVCAELDRPVPVIPSEVMAQMMVYSWPGNVRELENAITRAAVLARGPALSLDLVFPDGTPEMGAAQTSEDVETLDANLAAVERREVQRALVEAGGNKSEVARSLEISRPRLDRIIERHSLVV